MEKIINTTIPNPCICIETKPGLKNGKYPVCLMLIALACDGGWKYVEQIPVKIFSILLKFYYISMKLLY